ncbi:MAG: N-acetylglucosaminyldiphosphoundecaprenol N-acetyl-beta-D-mannosaminyltransferase [Desulforhopalus sp.]|jgi:N-acetylglucosaminyldiphosphoundecaprenol N-acetyl-beta-D-mannosaminyltransferase
MTLYDSNIEIDFKRDVWCLFGLPVDNITLSEMKDLIQYQESEKKSSILSTVNINWVISSFSNHKIRSAILNSDIVCIDGKPLLWLAQLLSYPMKEVVAGSTLIHELNEANHISPPLSLFLFGGDKDVGEIAKQKVNDKQGGLHVVGAINPGFGTIKEMSTETIIHEINSTKADILLVALGTAKGTQWIEENHRQLNARIVSHLGATINFLAGSVKRAPVFYRKAGLEWVWRIVQEPTLFSRYLYDGIALAKHLTKSLPTWIQYHYWQKQLRPKSKLNHQTKIQETENNITLLFGPSITGVKNNHLRALFCNSAQRNKDIALDFKDTKFVDGSFLGLLLVLLKWQRKNQKKITFINTSDRLNKILTFSGIYQSIDTAATTPGFSK